LLKTIDYELYDSLRCLERGSLAEVVEHKKFLNNFKLKYLESLYRKATAIEIFNNIELYTSEEQRLKVYQIRIASPGQFTFIGLAEIMSQLRELIKDLWYRNRVEKEKGELELIEKKMELTKRNLAILDDELMLARKMLHMHHEHGPEIMNELSKELQVLRELGHNEKIRYIENYNSASFRE
jgi:hypothetical protein